MSFILKQRPILFILFSLVLSSTSNSTVETTKPHNNSDIKTIGTSRLILRHLPYQEVDDTTKLRYNIHASPPIVSVPDTTILAESEVTTTLSTSTKDVLLEKLKVQNSNNNGGNRPYPNYDFYKYYYPYLKDFNDSNAYEYNYYEVNDYYYLYGGYPNEEYYDDDLAMAEESKYIPENLILEHLNIQNLCIKSQENVTNTSQLFLCQDTNLYEFACIGSNKKIASCDQFDNFSDLYVPLCIRKELLSYVVACSDPGVKVFCFPETTENKVELIPCKSESRRVCFREGIGLEYCSGESAHQTLPRKRRSSPKKSSHATVSPKNVNCHDCKVDILMEVDEDKAATPKIRVRVTPLKHKKETN